MTNVVGGEDMSNQALVDRAERSGEAEEADFVQAFRDHVKDRKVVSEVLKEYLEKNPKRSTTTEANYGTTVKLWIEHHGDRPLHDVTRSKALDWLPPEALAARLFGHAPLGINYSIYSKGRDIAELKEWVDRVSHPV